MTEIQDVEHQEHVIHDYRAWWIGIAVVSLLLGLMLSGGFASAIGFVVGAFIFPGILAAVVWAIWKILRRPLTARQSVSTFVVAWGLLVVLTLIGRLGQP